jgi:GTP diphosphokinase / guanosine-3',5'-bis(diphosphate) 3'-diphosphatase
MTNETWIRPPGRDLFFAPLVVELSPGDVELVSFAYQCSKYGHAKQVRENGQRYFDHPKSVAWIYIDELGGRDPRTIVGILLHDMCEDSFLLSPYRIAFNFGRDVALDVRAYTKLGKGQESVSAYLQRNIRRGPHVLLGKLCDRLHNVRDGVGCTAEKRRRQIDETVEWHLPLLLPALRQHGGAWATYADSLTVMFDATIAEQRSQL